MRIHTLLFLLPVTLLPVGPVPVAALQKPAEKPAEKPATPPAAPAGSATGSAPAPKP